MTAEQERRADLAAAREIIAEQLYKLFPPPINERKPPWVPYGNSHMQDEARAQAIDAIERAGQTGKPRFAVYRRAVCMAGDQVQYEHCVAGHVPPPLDGWEVCPTEAIPAKQARLVSDANGTTNRPLPSRASHGTIVEDKC